ncbi:hypothetical protein ACFQZO_13260 [Bradyrhizobium sp. GCM10027634]|uniref:hypothetical protein n=1 Tax=unclassified Bradyrhizobium TaxID=2631580 RepID=UPI001FEE006E|nr:MULTISPECIES: hypothetical protein [unclassified Bradyrhizobium]MDN5001856.1 hypothetical protein [Bradyrhizobium sp. WYCCWR 12677]
MLDGLYKVEYGINGAFGRSIMCLHDGKMLGGNSAFAHLGSYDVKDGVIAAEVITERHNDDPHFKPLMGADVTAIKVRGRTEGSTILLEGGGRSGLSRLLCCWKATCRPCVWMSA